MQLIVGTDSSWSLRAWICASLAGVDVKESVIDLAANQSSALLSQASATALVPVLCDGDIRIHDSLAIAEYLNEVSQGGLYPQQQQQRAQSRSLVAEMHSGFFALRSAMPFTLEAASQTPVISDAIRAELTRVEAIFSNAQLPFMHTNPGVVDAFYAILAYRLNQYGIQLQGRAGDYQQSLLQWPLLQQAITKAKEWKLRS